MAHIVLSRFGDNTLPEWDKVVTQLLLEVKLDGVVLDMRNNPGGYLQAAIDISSDFFDGGSRRFPGRTSRIRNPIPLPVGLDYRRSQ